MDQAMAGTQLIGSWVAGEPLPFNDFEQTSFQAGYSSLAARLPAAALERAVTASSTAMLIAAGLSYGTRVIETRGRKRPGKPPAPAPEGLMPQPPAVSMPGPNGHVNPGRPENEHDAFYMGLQPPPPTEEL